jgi:hypothetical protein
MTGDRDEATLASGSGFDEMLDHTAILNSARALSRKKRILFLTDCNVLVDQTVVKWYG